MIISAAEFKAKCLSLMDRVNEFHEEVIITKHGKPVAKLVPVTAVPEKPLFGFLDKKIQINEDIIAPLNLEWDASKQYQRPAVPSIIRNAAIEDYH